MRCALDHDIPEFHVKVRANPANQRQNTWITTPGHNSRTGFDTYSGWPGLDRREAPVLQSPGLRKDSSPGHPSNTGFKLPRITFYTLRSESAHCSTACFLRSLSAVTNAAKHRAQINSVSGLISGSTGRRGVPDASKMRSWPSKIPML